MTRFLLTKIPLVRCKLWNWRIFQNCHIILVFITRKLDVYDERRVFVYQVMTGEESARKVVHAGCINPDRIAVVVKSTPLLLISRILWLAVRSPLTQVEGSATLSATQITCNNFDYSLGRWLSTAASRKGEGRRHDLSTNLGRFFSEISKKYNYKLKSIYLKR